MTILLGKTLSTQPPNDIQTAILKLPRFTYHKNFPPLDKINSTTDRRWGCCIRSGQGILAQFIKKYETAVPNEYQKRFQNPDFLTLFFDLPDQPFSIHSFCNTIERCGGQPGQWVKPSLLAKVIKELLFKFEIDTIICENGLISRSEILTSFERRSGSPILVLLPMMLGQIQLDENMADFVRISLSLNQSIGIIGGQQGRAFFVVGYTKDSLLYFDPHTVSDAVKEIKDEIHLFESEIKKMKLAQINSSIMIGLFIQTMSDMDEIPQFLSMLKLSPIAIVDSLPLEENHEVVPDADEWNIIS